MFQIEFNLQLAGVYLNKKKYLNEHFKFMIIASIRNAEILMIYLFNGA